jgi:DNA polymerase III gamma/tau subunit
MKLLKSVMNISRSVFVLTTNNFDAVEVGVRSRCHCIPFNAAPEAKWLPLVRRILTNEGVLEFADEDLLPVIAACHGSARDIIKQAQKIVVGYRRKMGLPVQPEGVRYRHKHQEAEMSG